MRMYDLIEKKKRGGALSREEIRFMIQGYVSGAIPDYQMSAMLMAVYFSGMDDEETTALTLEMAHSGDMVDLSPIQGFKVDKHSTGGVGDKTTLIVGPIVAALGVRVAKMSGRGLGHTGGTIDKLESIPGFQTSVPREEFFDIVDSIPLIASSIMSKKLAAGSDGIVLDVKTGSGAFMKTLEDSVTLARKMVSIGIGAGRACTALITDMDVPLGFAIGNSLEVIESAETLRGRGPEDLKEVSLRLAAEMLYTAGALPEGAVHARCQSAGERLCGRDGCRGLRRGVCALKGGQKQKGRRDRQLSRDYIEEEIRRRGGEGRGPGRALRVG